MSDSFGAAEGVFQRPNRPRHSGPQSRLRRRDSQWVEFWPPRLIDLRAVQVVRVSKLKLQSFDRRRGSVRANDVAAGKRSIPDYVEALGVERVVKRGAHVGGTATSPT